MSAITAMSEAVPARWTIGEQDRRRVDTHSRQMDAVKVVDTLQARQAVKRFQSQARFTGLEFAVSRVGADRPSQARLALLGVLALVKDNTRLRTRLVRVRVRIAGSVRTVCIATRNDLDVLREIAIDGEYEIPGDIDPSTILDLGAHIGLASVFLSLRRPDARIIAVEANPELIDQLRRNTSKDCR